MKFAPMVLEEIAASGGFTHRLDLSVADIPAGLALAAANTIWLTAPGGPNVVLPTFDAGTIVKRVLLHLTTPFKNTAQSGFNSSTISIGDTGSATKFVSAVQINENGTEVIDTFPGTENSIYTASLQMVVTLNAMAGFSSSTLNVGKLYALFAIERAADQAWVKYPPFGPGTTATN